MEDVDTNIVQEIVDTARARRNTVSETFALGENAEEAGVDSVLEAGELELTVEQATEEPDASKPSLQVRLDRAHK